MKFTMCNLEVALKEALDKNDVYMVDVYSCTVFNLTDLTIADLIDVPETAFFVLVQK